MLFDKTNNKRKVSPSCGVNHHVQISIKNHNIKGHFDNACVNVLYHQPTGLMINREIITRASNFIRSEFCAQTDAHYEGKTKSRCRGVLRLRYDAMGKRQQKAVQGQGSKYEAEVKLGLYYSSAYKYVKLRSIDEFLSETASFLFHSF